MDANNVIKLLGQRIAQLEVDKAILISQIQEMEVEKNGTNKTTAEPEPE